MSTISSSTLSMAAPETVIFLLIHRSRSSIKETIENHLVVVVDQEILTKILNPTKNLIMKLVVRSLDCSMHLMAVAAMTAEDVTREKCILLLQVWILG